MKKGFTLMELLAVIIILAIIALIIAPIVINLINEAEESANLKSAKFYLDAVEQAILKKQLKQIKVPNGTYEITVSGNLCIGIYNKLNNNCTGYELEVDVVNPPKEGKITIKNKLTTDYSITLSNDEIVTNIKVIDDSCFEYMDNYVVNKNYTINYDICMYAFGSILDKQFETGAGDEICNGSQEYGDVINLAVYSGYDLNTLIDNNVINFISQDVETIAITGYKCGLKEKDVIIPSVINGKAVTKIGAFAFYPYDINGNFIEDKLINNVVIPNSIKTIEYSAFSNNKLTSITIPDNVTVIGRDAFYNNQLASVIIGNSVTTIGRAAFQNNLIANLTIGQNVQIIDKYAFYSNKLTKIKIPNSVQTIEDSAFIYNNLNTIIIGSGITYVGYKAFHNSSYVNSEKNIEYGPNDIKDIYINKNNMELSSQDIVNIFGLPSPTFHWNSEGPAR